MFSDKPRFTVEGNQNFATLKLLLGILILSCLLRNKTTQTEPLTFGPSPFLAQEFQIETHALGRDSGLNHLQNL